MTLFCAQAALRIRSGCGSDARNEEQAYEMSQQMTQAAETCKNRREKAATRMRFWIASMLAASLVVAAGGVALAEGKGIIGKSGSTAPMEMEFKGIPKMTVAFIRATRPTKGCGPAWDKLMAWAQKNDLVHKNTVYAGVSYDDPSTTPPGQARYDACITVPEATKSDGDVEIGEIAGRDYAVFLHRGPYENLKETYSYIYNIWAPKTTRKVLSDPAVEIYKTPSMDTPPEKLLTEVCVPLAK